MRIRLYDLVTEDMAIEDTIYVLGKALDKERISLDVFLKVSALTLSSLVLSKPVTWYGAELSDRLVYKDFG